MNIRPLLAALVLCIGSGPVFADQAIPFSSGLSLWGNALRTVDDDIADIVSAPAANPRKTGIILAGIGALVLADLPLTRAYQNTVEKAFDGFALPTLPWEKPLTDLGLASEDVWMVSGMAASYAYGVIAGDRRAERAAVLSSKALVYSFATSQLALKSIIARKRPCADLDVPNCDDGTFTDNPFDFGNFHGISVSPDGYGTAMPSYHFTQYFAVARVYSGVYDNHWLPYAAAGLLAVSNIRGHRHWVSDMAAGTVIGLGIGEVVLRNAETSRSGALNAVPQVTRAGTGLAFNMTF